MIRKAVVAGQFYPSHPAQLKKAIAGFKQNNTRQENALACILPHAGYMYSGAVAVRTLASVHIPDTCIIVGPNHTGQGAPASLMREGTWETPLGRIPVDTGLADDLLGCSHVLEDDPAAHLFEHSIEVMLPLIQELRGQEFSFVPVTLATEDELVYKDIAKSIAACIQKAGQKILLIAS